MPPHEPRPGWRIGPDESPDDYTLIRPVSRGGEGDVWLARRLDEQGRRLGSRDWAVKMLLPGHRAFADDDTDPLRTWRGRWYRHVIDMSDVEVPGAVLPRAAFAGPVPHPAGKLPAERGLYLVSHWVEAVDLWHWRADPRLLPKVVAEFCRIVDALHDHGRIHGDISPGNVMVDNDGQVWLIDFTYARFAEISRSTMALTPGFGAPERGTESTMATDAFAVGAVVYFLLAGTKLPTVAHRGLPTADAAQVAERALVGRGWSADIAGAVAAALSPDPAARPVPLRPWGEALAALIDAEAGRPDRVDVASDAGNRPVLVTGSLLGVSATGAWRPPPHGPSAPVDVAVEVDGTGRPVVFALDRPGTLWCAAGDRWEAVPGPPLRGRLAVTRDHAGAVVCLALSRDRLLVHRIEPGAFGVRQDLHAEGLEPASELRAVAIPPGGPLGILISDSSGLYCSRGKDGWARVTREQIVAAELFVNHWDDLEVLAATADGALLDVESLAGGWDLPVEVRCPVTVSDLAVLCHRDGRTLAAAGREGLWLLHGDQWIRLASEPSSEVALRPTRSWRLQLAALVGDRVGYWVEDHHKEWMPADPD